MTRKDLLAILTKANHAIREYKLQGLERSATTVAKIENLMIKKEITTFMNESFALGAAGRPCRHCGGTGRES